MKDRRNKIFAFLLFVENFLIFLIIIFLILNFAKIEKKYLQEIKVVKNYFYFHSGYFSLSFFLSLILIFLHILLWFFIFKFSKIEKSLAESANMFFKIHTRRLFSPLGPISPLISLEAENKYHSFLYIIYSYFILLGSFLFFSSLFFLFKNFVLLIPLVFLIIVTHLVKKIFLKNLNILQFLLLTLITFSIEGLSFLIFYLTNLIFLENINLYYSFIAYLIWVVISSIFPILYGTGPSEALSLFYIYYLGYNPSLFLLSLIYFRLITTYLPVLGIITKYLKIQPKSVDK